MSKLYDLYLAGPFFNEVEYNLIISMKKYYNGLGFITYVPMESKNSKIYIKVNKSIKNTKGLVRSMNLIRWKNIVYFMTILMQY